MDRDGVCGSGWCVLWRCQIGWTPLIAASFKGHSGVVELLLVEDANIETADKVGCPRCACMIDC